MNNDYKPNLMSDNNGFKYEPPVNNENKEIKKPKKKDDDDLAYKIGFIILIVVIVGVIGFCAWVMFSDSSTSTDEDTTVTTEVIDYSSKIEVTEAGRMNKYKDAKDVLFKVKNNSQTIVSIKLSVTFYDENGNMTDTGEATLGALGKGNRGYLVVGTTYAFATVKTKVVAEDVSETYADYTEKISEKHNLTDENMSVEITNNTDKTLQGVNTCVIFYQDDTIVGFGVNNIYNLESGDTNLVRITKPYDYTESKQMNFNKYSVNVFEAYAYK